MPRSVPTLGFEQPLAGVRVLDWAEGVAGPYACQLMGDLGADVIKVERPQGDWGRTSGPSRGGGGHHFRAFNRNKRNICLDLMGPGGLEVAHRLIAHSDVIVTAYRPGVTERLGIGYDQVIEHNPDLVYVRISAFGYAGPLAERPGSDTILQAVSGLMSQIGEPDGDPQRVGVPIIDFLAARDAVIGTLAALLAHAGGARPTGPIDVSLFASAAAFQPHLWQTWFDAGFVQARAGHRNPSLAPAGIYRTSDDRHVAVAVLRDSHFRKLCGALGLDELADDPRFITNADRLAHRDELERIVGPAFAARSFAEWLPVLDEHDVLAGPVMQIPDIAADPDLMAALPTVEVAPDTGAAASGRSVGLPISIGAGRPGTATPASSLGSHTREVLGELGFSGSEIARLVGDAITPTAD